MGYTKNTIITVVWLFFLVLLAPVFWICQLIDFMRSHRKL